MVKILRCRDVGVDCDFEARGATEEEILQKCRSTIGQCLGNRNLLPNSSCWCLARSVRSEKASRRCLK